MRDNISLFAFLRKNVSFFYFCVELCHFFHFCAKITLSCYIVLQSPSSISSNHATLCLNHATFCPSEIMPLFGMIGRASCHFRVNHASCHSCVKVCFCWPQKHMFKPEAFVFGAWRRRSRLFLLPHKVFDEKCISL